MGRPSKLTEAKWDELQRRLLVGEKASALAKEYGVSKSAISKRTTQPVEKVKAVVNQMLKAESAMRALPVSQRNQAVDLLDELRHLSLSAAAVARLGMQNAHRMAGIAQGVAQRVDDADPALKSALELKTLEWLGEIIRTHAAPGMQLLASNKEAFRPEGDQNDGASFIVRGGLPDGLPG